MNFGSKYLQDKVVKDCLQGKKFICLAITEPLAGSDVASIRTTAVKDPSGKFYIVNGEKKARSTRRSRMSSHLTLTHSQWITNGVFCDFFTVAVRTGGEGAGGISLLMLERGMKGLETKQMKARSQFEIAPSRLTRAVPQCMGVWPSGTTYITMEDVKVPVENLIGGENNGFKCIMYNFNHEVSVVLRPLCRLAGVDQPELFAGADAHLSQRWALTIQASRFARVCLEESFKYALKRKTFGKALIEHPVIRSKIAEMARQVECTHAQLENITYQMCTLSKKDAMEKVRSVLQACCGSSHASGVARGPHRAAEGAVYQGVRAMCARGCADLRGGVVRAWRAGREGAACSLLCG